MYKVTEIEDAILNALRADAALAGYVRTFAPIFSLREEDLKEVFPNFPAIGVISPNGSYSGSRPMRQMETGRFSIICFNRNLRSGVAPLRGGAPGEKGLWDMIEDCRRTLLNGLSGVSVTSCQPIRRYLLNAGGSFAIAALEVEIKWGEG